jgi:hypothetical protein
MSNRTRCILLVFVIARARRARKDVNYTFDDYDSLIRAAMRTDKDVQRGDRASRHAAFDGPRLAPAEEAQAGLRRGRSAAGWCAALIDR